MIRVLRSVSASPEALCEAVAELRRCGFVNYFGMQRFGAGCVRTHVVGEALIKGEFARAVALLLMPKFVLFALSLCLSLFLSLSLSLSFSLSLPGCVSVCLSVSVG